MRLYPGGLFVIEMLFLVKCFSVLVLLFVPALRPRENESSCLPFYVKRPQSLLLLPQMTGFGSLWCSLWQVTRESLTGTISSEELQPVDYKLEGL